MYIGSYKLNNTISFSFQALDGYGQAIDATGTPSFEVYTAEGAMSPSVTGNLSKVVGRTGFYVGELEVLESLGFESDYVYIIRISATIDGVDTLQLQTFNLTASDTIITLSESNVTQPLYNTKSGFLNKVRMATVSDAQTLSVINSIITEIRLGFFAKLGSARALEIASYVASDTPETTQDILKNEAMVAEVLWATILLIDQLPFMAIDNSASVRDEFNDEPLTRDASAIARYKESLKERLNKLLGKLESPANDNSGPFQAFSCGAVDSDGESDPYIIADNFVGKKL